MSDHLPDSLEQWPHDPFRLLGIERSVDAKDARRAYMRLIRRFKPDHFPEHFQRIRSAYEAIQRHLEMRDRYYSHWDQTAIEAASNATDAVADKAPEPAPAVRRADDYDAECEQAWRWAKEGREADAYARLVSLYRRGDRIEDACLRLYWLLTVCPELDSEREPCDWLAQALKSTGLRGRAMELYRREIHWNRSEVTTDRFRELRGCRAEPAALADLLMIRWPALSFLQHWEMITHDLAMLRKEVVFTDEATWARLLLAAMDHLAWFTKETGAKKVFENCQQEVEQMTHLHAELDRQLDRMDLLVDLAEGWQRLQLMFEVPRTWTALIPLAWTQEFDTVRPHLMPVLKRISDKPRDALAIFDRIHGVSRAVTTHLGTVFEEAKRQLEQVNPVSRTGDLEPLRRRVANFLVLHGRDYSSYRWPLLEFCLRESIAPEFVGEVAERQNLLPQTSEHRNLILADGPLRYVYAAHQAFWG